MWIINRSDYEKLRRKRGEAKAGTYEMLRRKSVDAKERTTFSSMKAEKNHMEMFRIRLDACMHETESIREYSSNARS